MDIADIAHLFVKKDARRGGLGSELVRQGINKLVALDCREIKVKPYPFDAGNDFAQAKQRLLCFYGRYGFKQKDNDSEFLWLTTSSQNL